MPAADYKVTLSPDVKELSQTLIDEIAAKAKEKAGSTTNYSATIAIPAGVTLDLHGIGDDGNPASLTIPDGMSVTFFGLSGGEAPTLSLTKNFDLAGSHAYVRFQNLKLKENGASYFVNQSASATVGDFALTDCEVANIKNAFFRLQGSNGITINNLTLTNCLFHDMCAGYSFIHVDAGSGKGVVKNVRMTDCTLYNVAETGKMFIYSKNTDMESVVLDHITMYNSIGGDNFLIDFGKNTFGAATFTISNSIFAKTPMAESKKNIRARALPVYTNTYTTNDFAIKLKGSSALDAAATDVFANPSKGDFTLKAAYSRLGAGDSRWIPASE